MFKGTKNSNLALRYEEFIGWIISKDNKEFKIEKEQPSSLLICLPILEEDIELFYFEIILKTHVEEFPLRNLLLFAIQSDSTYWMSLGCKWVIELYKLTKSLYLNEELRKVVSDKRIEQKMRHELRTILTK
ncbi:MAG: hypothetical protein K0S32_469 [Bacteroidetes bacterium]|jgi:hypothetical protein|nr:hypothetical protein [Bacteroidota bacterium]